MNKLNVHSIFQSISGEGGSFPQGSWCTFIRLQGCNLRCSWCDTYSSQEKGNADFMDIMDIADACKTTERVIITGGEPLMQHNGVEELIRILLRKGHQIQIETNGSFELPLWSPVYWVVDYKCPSSGMDHKMPSIHELADNIRNANYCGADVYLKWVVADENDLEFALMRIGELLFLHKIKIPNLISPLDARGDKLAGIIERIKKDINGQVLLDNIAFSVQIHKLFNLP